jgi:ABC-type glutathione transport system ATPase component
MIKIKDIQLHNSRNKLFLTFDGEVSFLEDTIYFIIGKSGVGKTSLVDFMTAPFTDDPIKKGEIILSGDVGVKTLQTGKKDSKEQRLEIKNSFNINSRQYINFIRKSVALIPQKTDSFQPAVPVRKQMYMYYKMALPKGEKPDQAEFNRLLEKLSPYAGWDKITVNPKDGKTLLLNDCKMYENMDNPGEFINIINKHNEEKTYEDKFSTGQLQRILILMALLRFHVSGYPVLIGDEFLVNFTYSEANDVLRDIITFFLGEKKKHKIAIFILHDLSFDFLKTLPAEFPVKLIAVEKDEAYQNQPRLKTETSDAQKITVHEMELSDFFNKKWANPDQEAVFGKFQKSYDAQPIQKNECNINIKITDKPFRYKIDIEESRPVQNIYRNINLELKKNRFIILTGFSGCGKTILCNQYIRECIKDKQSFRYFPSKSLSCLSADSQITIRQDLLLVYKYYNHVKSLDECKPMIKRMIKKINFYDDRFYDDKNEISDDIFEEFLNKKIYDLSGGQLQRYWLGRILFDYRREDEIFREPELLILDESIASLDCITKDRIIALLLREIFSKWGLTILFISHDLRDISVIYKTLFDNMEPQNIDKVFEHYEMFNHGLYRVRTPFPEYRDNLKTRKPNCYESLIDGSRLNLRFKTNNLPEELRENVK